LYLVGSFPGFTSI